MKNFPLSEHSIMCSNEFISVVGRFLNNCGISKYIVIKKQFREYYCKVLFKLGFNFSKVLLTTIPHPTTQTLLRKVLLTTIPHPTTQTLLRKVFPDPGKSRDVIDILENKIVNIFNIFTGKLCNNYYTNGISFSFSKVYSFGRYGLSKLFNKCRVNKTITFL